MVSTDFANHLKFRRVEFFQCIFKKMWRDSVFNKKLENINSNDFQMIFALSTNVCMRRSYVIVQEYFFSFFFYQIIQFTLYKQTKGIQYRH